MYTPREARIDSTALARIEREMRNAGASLADIVKFRGQAVTEKPVDVLAENIATVEVFMRCRLGVQLGYGAAVHTEIPRADIKATMEMRGVPPEERADVLDGVIVMEQAALGILN